jgi:hypothetical protein
VSRERESELAHMLSSCKGLFFIITDSKNYCTICLRVQRERESKLAHMLSGCKGLFFIITDSENYCTICLRVQRERKRACAHVLLIPQVVKVLFLVSLFGLCVGLQDHHHFEHGWSRWG